MHCQALERQVEALQLGGGASTEGGHRQALHDFFRRKNPEMIPKIGKLLASYAGKEKELFDKLSLKYGEPVLLDVDTLASPPKAPRSNMQAPPSCRLVQLLPMKG